MIRAILARSLCILLGATATAQSTDLSLQAIGERALHAVEKHLGVKLKKELVFRESDSGEVAKVMNKELVQQFEAQFEDAETAAEQRKVWVDSMAPAIIAKYEFGSGNVMVVERTLERLAKLIDEPTLDSDATMQAILVHECVHVLADQEHAFTKQLDKLGSTDAILAYNAVIEGHAQFIARQVCEKNGWGDGFRVFTKSIGKVPDLGNEAKNLQARVTAVSTSWAYYQGEEFIAAIHKAKGDEAIAMAYAEPPKVPAQIFHPDWYLDPSKQPKIDYSIDEGFDAFEKELDKTKWTIGRNTINEAQLESAMTLLDKKDIKRITKHLQVCKSTYINWTKPRGQKMCSAAVFVCDSVSEAAFLLACEEQLMRKKDEAMSKGAIRITDAKYTQKGAGARMGLLAQKTIRYRGQDLPVSTLVLAQDRIVLELTYSNQKVAEETIMQRGKQLLADILKRREPTAEGK